MKKKNYDPTWLISLAKEQHPKNSKLTKALRECKECFIESKSYIYFIDPDCQKPFKENIYLEDEQGETIIVDICEDGKIGGIELLKEVHKEPASPNDEIKKEYQKIEPHSLEKKPPLTMEELIENNIREHFRKVRKLF